MLFPELKKQEENLQEKNAFREKPLETNEFH